MSTVSGRLSIDLAIREVLTATLGSDGLKNHRFQKILDRSAGPMRKSVAGISDLRVTGKAGEEVANGSKATVDTSKMSKAEAVRKLNALTSDSERLGKLTKSDRDKINGFVAGNLKIEDVAAFLG